MHCVLCNTYPDAGDVRYDHETQEGNAGDAADVGKGCAGSPARV